MDFSQHSCGQMEGSGFCEAGDGWRGLSTSAQMPPQPGITEQPLVAQALLWGSPQRAPGPMKRTLRAKIELVLLKEKGRPWNRRHSGPAVRHTTSTTQSTTQTGSTGAATSHGGQSSASRPRPHPAKCLAPASVCAGRKGPSCLPLFSPRRTSQASRGGTRCCPPASNDRADVLLGGSAKV